MTDLPINKDANAISGPDSNSNTYIKPLVGQESDYSKDIFGVKQDEGTPDFKPIDYYPKLKVDILNAGLPVFTATPTYAGKQGEIVLVDNGSSSRQLCVYLGGQWYCNTWGGGGTTISVKRFINFSPYASDEAIVVEDGIYGAVIPSGMQDMVLTDVVASIHTNGSANSTDIQVRKRSGGADVDMLNNPLQLAWDGGGSGDSDDIDLANDDVQMGDMIYVDVDAIATDVSGLSVVLTFETP